jgi:hypothetical protein
MGKTLSANRRRGESAVGIFQTSSPEMLGGKRKVKNLQTSWLGKGFAQAPGPVSAHRTPRTAGTPNLIS